jgi:hypothetical protein
VKYENNDSRTSNIKHTPTDDESCSIKRTSASTPTPSTVWIDGNGHAPDLFEVPAFEPNSLHEKSKEERRERFHSMVSICIIQTPHQWITCAALSVPQPSKGGNQPDPGPQPDRGTAKKNGE